MSVAGLIIKLNNRDRIKIIHVYASTSAYVDENVKKFYEDIEATMEWLKTQYSFTISNFNAKVGKKRVTVLRNFGMNTQNNKGDMLESFAERNNSKKINTFFDRKANKWI